MNPKARSVLIARYKKEQIKKISSSSSCLGFFKRVLADLLIFLAISIVVFLIIFFWSLFDYKLNWQLTNTSEGVQKEPATAKGTPYNKAKISQITDRKIEEYLVKMRSFKKKKELEKVLITGTAILNKVSGITPISFISIPKDDIKIGITNRTSAKFLANYVIQQKYLKTNVYFYGVFSGNKSDFKREFNSKRPWEKKRIYIKQNKNILSCIILNSFNSCNLSEIKKIIKTLSADEIVAIGIYSTRDPSFKITVLKVQEKISNDKQSFNFSMFNQF